MEEHAYHEVGTNSDYIESVSHGVPDHYHGDVTRNIVDLAESQRRTSKTLMDAVELFDDSHKAALNRSVRLQYEIETLRTYVGALAVVLGATILVLLGWVVF